MWVQHGGKDESLLNTLICISKWYIWKARNKVKYDKIHINQNVLCNIWKQTLKFELKVLLTANSNDTIDQTKILTILSCYVISYKMCVQCMFVNVIC